MHLATPHTDAPSLHHPFLFHPPPPLQTNVVSVDLMANALLAAGASPAMVASEEEAADFAAAHATAVLVNLGTLTPAALAGQHAAVGAAVAAGKPWVLDPVACGATPYRTAAAVALARRGPALVRGNASEVAALAAAVCRPGDGGGPAGGAGTVRGVDSILISADAPAAALAAALTAAAGRPAVVAVSGAVDTVVLPGGAALRVHGGDAMLADITATGCSVTALCAAAVGAAWAGGRTGPADTAVAAAAALAAFGVAAERALASGRVHGPASLRVGLVDALAGLGRGGGGVEGSGMEGVVVEAVEVGK